MGERGSNGTSGQVESLWGRIKVSDMGARVSRERPPIGTLPSERVKASTKSVLSKTFALGSKRISTENLAGGTYKPKTKETSTAWEFVLAFVAICMGDTPREVLIAAAEECAHSILGMEDEASVPTSSSPKPRDLVVDRKAKVESILGSLTGEQYGQLVNLIQKLTDFTFGADKRTTAKVEKRIEEETAVAVVFEEEEEEDVDNILVEEEGEEEEEDFLVSVDGADEGFPARHVETQMSSGKADGLPLEEGDTTIDLESLAFPQGGHTMTNRRCIVPEKSTKYSRAGYEEIHIPAPSPKPMGPDEHLIAISTLPSWAQLAFTGTNTLNRVQSKLYECAFHGSGNFLLCAPTGAGKTNVALLAMLHEIGLHFESSMNNHSASMDLSPAQQLDRDQFKIVYVAPMKALVQEMVANFSRKLQPYGIAVAELTGDAQLTRAQISETQVLVTTPEKWDVITRKNNDASYTRLVRLLIIDEIHLLHDERGPVLEALVARTLRQVEATGQATRLVGLSATLPNYLDVARFLRVDRQAIFYFDATYRPCPLAQQFVGLTEKRPLKRMELMNEIVFEKVMERAGQCQILVFVHSRKETAKTARAIRDAAMARGNIGTLLREAADSRTALKEANVTDTNLAELLPYGLAIHHAGLNREDRGMVERLFADGHAQVLVSTATLAWGVNLPAHTVIIKGTQVYRPERGGWTELSAQDVLQMLGRAGRPQYDIQGEGIIVTTQGEVNFYLSLLNQQLPIESQLISALVDHLNAEIVLGAVTNMTDALFWLRHTYLFVRLQRAGHLYGMPPSSDDETDQTIQTKFCRQLLHAAASQLEKTGLLHYDRRTGGFRPTELARIASHYYLPNYSISAYATNLKNTSTDIDLLRIFSLSHEFRLLPVRLEERVELATLASKVPIPLRESPDDPLAKVNILLQVYISHLRLDGFALAADMIYVTQSAGRILRALFEMALRRGWARVAHRCLDFCRMVERRQWRCLSPLRQLPSSVALPPDVLRKLERKEFSWDLLWELSPVELGELIRTPSAGKQLHTSIRRLPRVRLATATIPLTRDTVRVEVTVQGWIPSGNGGESFWLMVEDGDGEMILFAESLVLYPNHNSGAHPDLYDERKVSTIITLPEPSSPMLFVTVTADRWLGVEARQSINLMKMTMPERRGTTLDITKVDDTDTILSDYPNILQAYSAFHGEAQKLGFNDVQKAIIPAAFKSDLNIFAGASPAWDLLKVSEFAIWRMRIQDPTALIVYIHPREKNRLRVAERWNHLFGGSTLLTSEVTTDLKLIEDSLTANKESKIVISSPRGWDQLSRRWKSRRNVQRLALLIVDKTQDLAYDSTMEVILSRTRFMAAQLDHPIRIFALGLPLWNARELCAWLGVDEHSCCFNIDRLGRKLTIIPHYYHGGSALISAMPQTLWHMVSGHLQSTQSSQAFIYVADTNQARTLAVDLAASSSKEFTPINDIKDDLLRECLESGVAYWDGTTSFSLLQGAQIVVMAREMAEDLLEIAEYHAGLVIILGTQEYRGKLSGYEDYPLVDLLFMLSTVNSAGEAIIICPASRRASLTRQLEDPLLPLESGMDVHLAETLNAEIAVKTVTSVQDAVDYLTWTFMYRRLARNPNYYGLMTANQLALSEWLSEAVEGALEELKEHQCITMDGGEKDQMEEAPQLATSNLGLIAAYYGVTPETIATLARQASTKLTPRSLLEAVASTREFDDVLVMRDEERRPLDRLQSRCPWPVNFSAESSDEEVHRKVFVLLQAHCARLPLTRPSLEDDRLFIAHRALPVLLSAVDVLCSLGATLRTVLTAMETVQMLVQALLANDPPLKQVLPPGINDDTLATILKKASTIYDFDEECLALVPEEYRAMVVEAVNRYPSLQVTQLALSEPSDETAIGTDRILKATIERSSPVGPVIAPCLGSLRKEEAWWLLVGRNDDGTLLGIKRFTVGEQPITVQLELYEIDVSQHVPIKVYLVCDSYLGADQEFDLTL